MINVVGESILSNEGNGAIILTNPDAPTNLANNPLQTSATQISISWQLGATNGGAAVEDYKISFDQGTNNFVPLASGVSTTSYLVTNLIAGTTYKFKVQARNSFGYSTYSSEVSILAAQVPDKPVSLANVAATTTAVQIGLEWTDGAYDGGTSIIDYTVFSDGGTGTWTTLATGV